MVKLVRVLCLLLLIPASVPARADETGKLRNLLDLVGFSTYLEAIPSGLEQAFADPSGPMADEAVREAASDLARAHFSPEAMTEEVIASLDGALTGEQLDELTAFYSDGLGKRATELEVAAQQPGMDATVEAEGLALLQALAAEKDPRLDLYRRIVASTRTVENGTTLGMNMTYAMLSGMMGSPALPYQLTDEQILGIVNQQSGQIRAQVEAAAYTQMAYTYREMSLDELGAYADFIETGTAQLFYQRVEAALRTGLLSRAQGFGHDLMVLMGVRKT